MKTRLLTGLAMLAGMGFLAGFFPSQAYGQSGEVETGDTFQGENPDPPTDPACDNQHDYGCCCDCCTGLWDCTLAKGMCADFYAPAPGDLCNLMRICGSPSLVTMDRADFLMPLPDGGLFGSQQKGCSSCGGAAAPSAGGEILRAEWWRFYHSRLKIPDSSFGINRMYSGYDYRLLYTDSTHLHMYDPVTQQELQWRKLANGTWTEDWNYWRGTTITSFTGSNVTIRYPGGGQFRFELTNYPGGQGGTTNQRWRLVSIQDRRGNQVNFNYALPATDSTIDVMKWTTIQDSFGRTIQVAYTTFQNVNVISQVTLPDGRQVNYSYDTTKCWEHAYRVDYGNGLYSTWADVGAHYLGKRTYNEALMDAHNYKETFTMQPNDGRIYTIKRGDGTWRFLRCDRNLGGTPQQTTMTFWINGLVREVTETFNPSYSVARVQVRNKRVDGTWTAQETFNAADRAPMNQNTLPDGRTTNFTLNSSFYKPTQISNPDGTSESYTYNTFTQPLTHTDRRGKQETWTYDNNGNMLTHNVAVGQPEAASESWTYNTSGQPLTHTDFNGQTTTYTYDANGYLHTMATPAGDGQPAGTTTYNYDIGGRLTSVTDPVGHTTSYQYDNLNRVTQITYADNSTETTTYGTADLSARVLETKDRNNNKTIYTYDTAGRVTKIEQKDGTTQAILSTTTKTYDSGTGRLMSEDRDGDITSYSYDHLGRILSTTVTPKAGVNLTTTTTYDVAANYDLKRVQSITDGYGRKTSYTYDAMDRVLSMSRELTSGGVQLTTSYEYDANGNKTVIVDPRGIRNTYEFDARNRLTTEHLAVGSQEAASISYTYDANSNRLTKVDENGKTWTNTYTTMNKLRTANDPLGHGSVYEYFADGLTKKVTNANGHDTSYTYDNCCGHPTTVTNADDTFKNYQYDFKGNITQVTDEEGNSVAYQYDGLDRRTRITLDPGGLNLATVYTYNATPGTIGTTVTVTSPSGQTITTTYDGLGRQSEVSGDTPHVTYGYDQVVNGYVQSTVTDALNNTTSSLVDGAGRTVKVVDAAGKNTVLAYDEDSNRTSLTDRDGNITTSTYDARNRLTRTTQDSAGISAETNYQYDAEGNLTQLTDAQNNVTKYEYDDAGRQTSATYAFGTDDAKTWSYTYKNLGQVDTITKPDASTVTYTYDVRERLTSRAYSGVANPDTFSYYGNGLLKTAVSGIYGTTVDRSQGMGVSYDNAGRLLQEIQNAGNGAKTVSFTYTPDSLTDTITYPSGKVLHDTYTTFRQLNAVQLDGANIASSHVYDDAGRLTQRNYANGKVANWSYDNKNRMTEVDHVGVQKYQYTYTDEGDPLTQTDVTAAAGNEAYTYDTMHRLATMQRGPQGNPDFAQAWTLDKVGNWTSFDDNGQQENRTHNALNQLTQRAGNDLAYDANGNQTDDGSLYTFVYDANNRLKEVKDRATNDSIMTCKYDALGRRVERNVLRPTELQTGGTTRYYYAGDQIVEERDGDDWVQAVYTYGQYIDEPLSMDHVPTSQPASQPAGEQMTESMPTPTPAASATAMASALPTQDSPTPSASVTSVAETPSPEPTGTPDVVATQVAQMYATPTITAVPTITPASTSTADVIATQMAIMYATPTVTAAPTLTPVPTSTADVVATQMALMYGTPTPDPMQTVEPMATATALPSLTPAPTASATSVPSVVNTPAPTPESQQMRTMDAPTSQPSLQRYYYHTNQLYSVAALTDDQGAVVERYRYDAYGLCTTFDAAYDNPMAFSRLGNPFTFTGRELDPESGLMHYRARAYSPVQGRFLQADPIGYNGGINLYEYVLDNPISMEDSYGDVGSSTTQTATQSVTIQPNTQPASRSNVDYDDYTAAHTADWGSFLWTVKWKTTPPSTKGGIIVQYVTLTADVKKCCDNTQVSVDTHFWPLWEEWDVSPNNGPPTLTDIRKYGDQFSSPFRGECTKGDINIVGQATFYEGKSCPSTMHPTFKPPTNDLPTTQIDPKLTGGSDTLSRSVHIHWECDGKTSADIIVTK